MDVPCPRANSTDLQKVSLACEEVLYGCDRSAQFHGVLVESGGPGVLVGPRQRMAQGRRSSPQKAVGWRLVESAGIFQRTCCPPKYLSFQSTPRRPLLKVCWPQAGKIAWRVKRFGPNHEI